MSSGQGGYSPPSNYPRQRRASTTPKTPSGQAVLKRAVIASVDVPGAPRHCSVLIDDRMPPRPGYSLPAGTGAILVAGTSTHNGVAFNGPFFNNPATLVGGSWCMVDVTNQTVVGILQGVSTLTPALSGQLTASHVHTGATDGDGNPMPGQIDMTAHTTGNLPFTDFMNVYEDAVTDTFAGYWVMPSRGCWEKSGQQPTLASGPMVFSLTGFNPTNSTGSAFGVYCCASTHVSGSNPTNGYFVTIQEAGTLKIFKYTSGTPTTLFTSSAFNLPSAGGGDHSLNVVLVAAGASTTFYIQYDNSATVTFTDSSSAYQSGYYGIGCDNTAYLHSVYFSQSINDAVAIQLQTTLNTAGNLISTVFGNQVQLMNSGVYTGYMQQSSTQIIDNQAYNMQVGDWIWQEFYSVPVGFTSGAHSAGPAFIDDSNNFYYVAFLNGTGVLLRNSTTLATLNTNNSTFASGHDFLMGIQYLGASAGYRIMAWLDGDLDVDYTDNNVTVNHASIFPGFRQDSNTQTYHKFFAAGPDPALVNDCASTARNIVADSDLKFGPTYWNQQASAPVTAGAAPNGGNGWVYTAPGSISLPAPYQFWPVLPLTTYTFSCYVDSTNITAGGTIGVQLTEYPGGSTTHTVYQANGNKGRIVVTFTTAASQTSIGASFFWVSAAPTIASTKTITIAQPQLEIGSIPTSYKPNVLDDESSGFARSTPHNPQGSIPPNTIATGYGWSATDTATSINLTILATTFNLPDGSTISAGTVSHNYTGLVASTVYHFDIAWSIPNATWWINGVAYASATLGAGAPGKPTPAQNAIWYYGDQLIGMTLNGTVTTPASGTGSGSGSGGDACPASFQMMETKEKGFIRADELECGMHLRDPDGGWNEIHQVGLLPTMVWELRLSNGEDLYISDNHMIMNPDGHWYKVKDLVTGLKVRGMDGDLTVVDARPFKPGHYVPIVCDNVRYVLGHSIGHNLSDGCPADFQLVETKERGFVPAGTLVSGEHLRDPDQSWNRIKAATLKPTDVWFISTEEETVYVDSTHCCMNDEGAYVPVTLMKVGDKLRGFPSGTRTVADVGFHAKGSFMAIKCNRHRYVLGFGIGHNVTL